MNKTHLDRYAYGLQNKQINTIKVVNRMEMPRMVWLNNKPAWCSKTKPKC